MTDDRRSALLQEHDTQLRTAAEVDAADEVLRIGPLWLARFGDRGFVTYESLAGRSDDELAALVAAAVDHFAARPGVASFEWKTRGHDRVPALPEILREAGLLAGEHETVMAGDARLLAVDVPLDGRLTLRKLAAGPGLADDVRAVGRFHSAVFGPDSPDLDAEVLAALTNAPARNELWVVETRQGRVVSAGRLTLARGTSFAGLWGGAVDPEWRHHGVYRALTAARARSALAMGATYLYAECTADSRPILERSGLLAITTTQPYVWTAPVRPPR
jgi:hypothetical protein